MRLLYIPSSVRWSTGNDISGPLFLPLFSLFKIFFFVSGLFKTFLTLRGGGQNFFFFSGHFKIFYYDLPSYPIFWPIFFTHFHRNIKFYGKVTFNNFISYDDFSKYLIICPFKAGIHSFNRYLQTKTRFNWFFSCFISVSKLFVCHRSYPSIEHKEG